MIVSATGGDGRKAHGPATISHDDVCAAFSADEALLEGPHLLSWGGAFPVTCSVRIRLPNPAARTLR
jgi:hypothetical protein